VGCYIWYSEEGPGRAVPKIIKSVAIRLSYRKNQKNALCSFFDTQYIRYLRDLKCVTKVVKNQYRISKKKKSVVQKCIFYSDIGQPLMNSHMQRTFFYVYHLKKQFLEPLLEPTYFLILLIY